MRAASIETEVPRNLEEARERAFAALSSLRGGSDEISNRIANEHGSIRALEEERRQIQMRMRGDSYAPEGGDALGRFQAEEAQKFARLCAISEATSDATKRIEALEAERIEKESKIPAAAAALREEEVKINTVRRVSFLQQIESASGDLARMEEGLRSEEALLGTLIGQRSEISLAVGRGKEKREKLQEIGARILDAQNYIEGTRAAIEPARAALDAMRGDLQEVENKLADAQSLREIEKLKQKGERLGESLRKKLKEENEIRDSIRSVLAEVVRLSQSGERNMIEGLYDVPAAARACAEELMRLAQG
jgi:hypothetical protein